MVCILNQFNLQMIDLYIEKQSITSHNHFICKHLMVIENKDQLLSEKVKGKSQTN